MFAVILQGEEGPRGPPGHRGNRGSQVDGCFCI